jgi:hypothetical protein
MKTGLGGGSGMTPPGKRGRLVLRDIRFPDWSSLGDAISYGDGSRQSKWDAAGKGVDKDSTEADVLRRELDVERLLGLAA